MDFLDLAKARYSERNFTDREVEENKLATILEAGRIAPTAANCQPQRLLVIRDKAVLEKLGKAANVYGAPLAVVVCYDKEKAWTRPFDRKQVGDIDASIVTDHMMLQAAELGLGSVWICYFKPDVLRSELSIPDNYEPVNILAIGYAKDAPASPDRHAAERTPLSATVKYDHF